ncbi:MAG: hypothetical protein HC879_19285 [Leptolyngbyaceae cyanobacterium SL_5_9]|nr:hypothetical protein [Leptolyngbyaceae cyanobacterium SL_5_9]NJO74502.1 hypothetical protein [Leptolyngbyaceae cyanobacterium RM1_406_9]
MPQIGNTIVSLGDSSLTHSIRCFAASFRGEASHRLAFHPQAQGTGFFPAMLINSGARGLSPLFVERSLNLAVCLRKSRDVQLKFWKPWFPVKQASCLFDLDGQDAHPTSG